MKVMKTFEELAGLDADGYWIEARPGGAPSWSDTTDAASLVYELGAVHMAWAAHGDDCLGFPGLSNDELRERVAETVRTRAPEFPAATHYGLFAYADEVELVVKIEASDVKIVS
jgi:hypothetical protein